MASNPGSPGPDTATANILQYLPPSVPPPPLELTMELDKFPLQTLEQLVSSFVEVPPPHAAATPTSPHEYLVSFSGSPSAWLLSLALIHSSTHAEVRLFGTTTLHRKVVREWRTLPPHAQHWLVAVTTSAVSSWTPHPVASPSTILTKLSITLVSMVLLCPPDTLKSTLEGFLASLFTSVESVQQTGESLAQNPAALQMTSNALTVLQFIPEELENQDMPLSSSSLSLTARILRNSTGRLLSLITSLIGPAFASPLPASLESAASSQSLEGMAPSLSYSQFPSLMLPALRTALSWIRFGLYLPDLLASPWIPAFLGIIHTARSHQDPQASTAFEISTEALAEVFGGGSGAGVTRYESSILAILAPISAFTPLWTDLVAKAPTDKTAARHLRRLARLVSSIGESHYHLIAKGSDAAMAFTALMLEIIRYPDPKIADLTLEFWDAFSDALSTQELSVQARYHGVFEALTVTLANHMALPEALASAPPTGHDWDEWARWRGQVREGFKGPWNIIGDRAAQGLCQLISTVADGQGSVIQMEALLGSLVGFGECVGVGVSSESSSPADSWTASLIGFVLQVVQAKALEWAGKPQGDSTGSNGNVEGVQGGNGITGPLGQVHVPTLSNLLLRAGAEGLLWQTSIELLGAYGDWIVAHPSHLPRVLEILLLALQLGGTVAPVATKALKQLCYDPAPLAQHPALVIQVLTITRSALSASINHDHARDLVKASARLITALPLSSALDSLSNLLKPLQERLMQVANPSELVEPAFGQFLSTIALTRAVFAELPTERWEALKSSNPGSVLHPVTAGLGLFHPIFQQWLEVSASEEDLVSAVGDVYEAAAVSAGVSWLGQLAPEIVSLMAAVFAVHPSPPPLNTLSTLLIKAASGGPGRRSAEEVLALLPTSVHALSSVADTMGQVLSQNNLAIYVDVIGSWLKFGAALARSLPTLLIAESQEQESNVIGHMFWSLSRSVLSLDNYHLVDDSARLWVAVAACERPGTDVVLCENAPNIITDVFRALLSSGRDEAMRMALARLLRGLRATPVTSPGAVKVWLDNALSAPDIASKWPLQTRKDFVSSFFKANKDTSIAVLLRNLQLAAQ